MIRLLPATLLLALIMTAPACIRLDKDPPFSIVPAIRLLDVSQTQVREFTDTLAIRLAYTDGDGDLGNPDPDIPSVILRDARLAQPDSLHLKPLAPVGAGVAIQGELLLQLPLLFLLGNSPSESTTFDITLFDRSGHVSNTVRTPTITIIR